MYFFWQHLYLKYHKVTVTRLASLYLVKLANQLEERRHRPVLVLLRVLLKRNNIKSGLMNFHFISFKFVLKGTSVHFNFSL